MFETAIEFVKIGLAYGALCGATAVPFFIILFVWGVNNAQ